MESINLWITTVIIAVSGIALHLYYQGRVLAKPKDTKRIGEQMWKVGLMWFVIIIGLFINNCELEA